MVAKESRLPHVEAEACNASEACGAIADSIRHAPLTAALVGFGAGLALGCMVVHAVKQKRAEQDVSAARRLGNSILQALDGVVPEAVSRRFVG